MSLSPLSAHPSQIAQTAAAVWTCAVIAVLTWRSSWTKVAFTRRPNVEGLAAWLAYLSAFRQMGNAIPVGELSSPSN